MCPILFHLGPLSFKTYGLFIALAAIATLHMLRREFKRRAVAQSHAENTIYLGLITGLLGSRLLYAITEHLSFVEFWRIWDGGLSFTGGLIAASIALAIYMRRNKIPLASFSDSIAIALPLGHAIGRLGCFAAGCCWGSPSQLPWAVHFNNPESFIPSELLGVSLHPAQIYESLGLLLIFALLSKTQRRFPGKLFGLYLILYAALRFSLEFLRGDALLYPGLGGLSFIQALLLVLALPAGILWILIGKSKN